MTAPELQQLLRVLDERGIGLGREDVVWAFESPKIKADMISWVQQCLSPTNLLTAEELSFSKYGVGATEYSRAGAVLADQDFESAISSLEACTTSIEKHCRLLEAQKQALQNIRARNVFDKSSEDVKAHRSNNLTRETVQLDFEIDELTSSLRNRLLAALKQGPSASGSVQSDVNRVLEKDDRLLDGLEKILSQLSGPSNGSANAEEVEHLCQALIMQSSAEIRSQIDAAYSTHSQANGTHSNGTHVNGLAGDIQQQRESLQAELDELCREIDGLSTMSVDSQYRHPISRALDDATANFEFERAAWNDYLNATLQYLVARLDTINDHFRDVEAHSIALKTISKTLDSLLSVKTDPKQESRPSTRSPTKPSQNGLKPLRLVQANLSEAHDPTTQLLRSFDIQVVDANESARLPERLAEALKGRNENLSTLLSASEQGITSQVAGSIGKAIADVHALLAALYAHSNFGNVNMIDERIQRSIAHLEEQTQEQRDEMRELDMDGIARTINLKQQSLLK